MERKFFPPAVVVRDLIIFALVVGAVTLFLWSQAHGQARPDPCAVWPQPSGCAPRAWYDLSYILPKETQQQILVDRMAPLVNVSNLALVYPQGSRGLPYPIVQRDRPMANGLCFRVDPDGVWYYIDCNPVASTRRAAQAMRRTVKNLERRYPRRRS